MTNLAALQRVLLDALKTGTQVLLELPYPKYEPWYVELNTLSPDTLGNVFSDKFQMLCLTKVLHRYFCSKIKSNLALNTSPETLVISI